jgi:hypothetical protein
MMLARTRSARPAWLRVLVVSAAAVAPGLLSRSGEPCALFASGATAHVPSMSVEQTLIVFDEATATEHFVREVTFADAASTFGFVVPTPARPVVKAVSPSPFAELARHYPVNKPIPAMAAGPPPRGLAVLAAVPPGVQVLSEERVGSFTAFVLAANDSAGIKRWLDENHFVSTAASEPWLRHYVGMGYYYAALRYEPHGRSSGTHTTRAETLRISFASPLPYYPYFEPTPTEETPARPRELAVWLVSSRRYVPISAVTADRITWMRPMQEWTALAPQDRAFVTGLLGPDLGPLVPARVPTTVQAYEDQKTTRASWGDVVFVPEQPLPIDSARGAEYRKLMAAVDPGLPGGP